MARYGFYSKGRYDGEVINLTHADNPASAIKYFAKLKNLELKEFVKLYEVIER